RPCGFGAGRDWFERPCRVQARDAWMSRRPPDVRRPKCTSERCPGRSTGSRLPSGLPDIDETVELQFVEEQLPQFRAARERHSDAFQDPSGLEIPDCPRRNAEIVGCGPKGQKPGRDELARRGTLGGALRNLSTRMRHWVREFTVASAP